MAEPSTNSPLQETGLPTWPASFEHLLPAVENSATAGESRAWEILQQVARSLRQRDKILEALAYASQRLIGLRLAEDLETILPGVLEQLAMAIGVERAYILQLTPTSPEGKTVEQGATLHTSWRASPSLPQPAAEFQFSPAGIERWIRELSNGLVIYGSVADFAVAPSTGEAAFMPTNEEQAFILRLPAESFAWLPIFSAGQWWGILGFDSTGDSHNFLPAEIEALKIAAGSLGSALAHQRVHHEEREQRNLAEALRKIATMLNSTLDIVEVLDRMPAMIGQVVPHDSASIFLLEKNQARQVRHHGRQEVENATSESANGASAQVSRPTQVKELPSLGQMIATGRPLIIQDTRQSALWVERSHLKWVRSYLGAPIQSDGQVIGFINLNSATPGFFKEQHAGRLQAFADQAAIALQNAHLFEQALTLATLEERQRLARDLHDSVSQTLWTASIIAEVLPALWNKDQEDGQRSLEQLRRLTQGALAEMRTLLLELRPAALMETKLNDLLQQLAQSTMSRRKLSITLEIQENCVNELPPEIQVGVYRIAQEALNNIAKHSRASQVHMRLHATPEHLELLIRDNGLGFDQNKIAQERARMGLGIMRERAAAIHADLKITSAAGKGTLIQVDWRAPTDPRIDMHADRIDTPVGESNL